MGHHELDPREQDGGGAHRARGDQHSRLPSYHRRAGWEPDAAFRHCRAQTPGHQGRHGPQAREALEYAQVLTELTEEELV